MLRIIVEELVEGQIEQARVLGIINLDDMNPGAEIGEYRAAVFEPMAPANTLTPEKVKDSHIGTFYVQGHNRRDGWRILALKAFDTITTLQRKIRENPRVAGQAG